MDYTHYFSGALGGFLMGIAVCYAYMNYVKKPKIINIELTLSEADIEAIVNQETFVRQHLE